VQAHAISTEVITRSVVVSNFGSVLICLLVLLFFGVWVIWSGFFWRFPVDQCYSMVRQFELTTHHLQSDVKTGVEVTGNKLSNSLWSFSVPRIVFVAKIL